jgi:hypothetical protein
MAACERGEMEEPNHRNQARTEHPQLEELGNLVRVQSAIENGSEGHQHEDEGAGELAGVDANLTLGFPEGFFELGGGDGWRVSLHEAS